MPIPLSRSPNGPPPGLASTGTGQGSHPGTNGLPVDLAGNRLWKRSPGPGEFIPCTVFRSGGKLLVERLATREGMLERLLAGPVEGAVPTLIHRSGQYRSRTSDGRPHQIPIYPEAKAMSGSWIWSGTSQ